jgi:serine/threonine protein kinase
MPDIGAGGIGQIKIADFGLSKVIWETQTMTPCGTVGYTAPEIVKDERYSKSVDMWALGCVLYTLLCGFPPFYDESIDILTEKVAKGQYTFLSPWWDEISKSAQDLISHLLTVDPEKRYTIKEFLAHPWIRGDGPTPHDEMKPTPEALAAFAKASHVVEGDKKYDFRSPAAVNLREVFDVSYAVHRQEEESQRRRQLGIKAAGAAPEHLSQVEEADEEGSSPDRMKLDSDTTEQQPQQSQPQEPQQQQQQEQQQQNTASTKALEVRMRNASLQDQDKPDAEHRGRSREPAAPAANEKGYGQHSAAVAAAARQQVKDRQRQKGVFELNLDGATLLGRRGVKPAKVGGA